MVEVEAISSGTAIAGVSPIVVNAGRCWVKILLSEESLQAEFKTAMRLERRLIVSGTKALVVSSGIAITAVAKRVRLPRSRGATFIVLFDMIELKYLYSL